MRGSSGVVWNDTGLNASLAVRVAIEKEGGTDEPGFSYERRVISQFRESRVDAMLTHAVGDCQIPQIEFVDELPHQIDRNRGACPRETALRAETTDSNSSLTRCDTRSKGRGEGHRQSEGRRDSTILPQVTEIPDISGGAIFLERTQEAQEMGRNAVNGRAFLFIQGLEDAFRTVKFLCVDDRRAMYPAQSRVSLGLKCS